jgi:hypothetical protein
VRHDLNLHVLAVQKLQSLRKIEIDDLVLDTTIQIWSSTSIEIDKKLPIGHPTADMDLNSPCTSGLGFRRRIVVVRLTRHPRSKPSLQPTHTASVFPFTESTFPPASDMQQK